MASVVKLPAEHVTAWDGRGTIAHFSKASQKKFLSLPQEIHVHLQLASAQLNAQNSFSSRILAGDLTLPVSTVSSAAARYEWARFMVDHPGKTFANLDNPAHTSMQSAAISNPPQPMEKNRNGSTTLVIPIRHDVAYHLEHQIARWEMPLRELKDKEICRQILTNVVQNSLSKLAKDNGLPFKANQVNLFCIGAHRSGFAVPGNDLDLQLVYDKLKFPDKVKCDVPHLLELDFLSEGFSAVLAPCQFAAGVTILKVWESPWDDDGKAKSQAGIRCNIYLSNSALTLQSAQLLHCYRLCSDRLYEMGVVVKTWAAAREINNPHQGTLSSFGYILMLVHYLANIVKPPVIPNLHVDKPESTKAQCVEGRQICFWQDEKGIKARTRAEEVGATQNHQSTATLLQGFFRYYDGNFNPFFCWKNDVISIRTSGGLIGKHAKNWVGKHVDVAGNVEHRVLAIEDPFRTERNIGGNVVLKSAKLIRHEFQRASNILIRTGSAIDHDKNVKLLFSKREPTKGRFAGRPSSRSRNIPPKSSRGRASTHAETVISSGSGMDEIASITAHTEGFNDEKLRGHRRRATG